MERFWMCLVTFGLGTAAGVTLVSSLDSGDTLELQSRVEQERLRRIMLQQHLDEADARCRNTLLLVDQLRRELIHERERPAGRTDFGEDRIPPAGLPAIGVKVSN